MIEMSSDRIRVLIRHGDTEVEFEGGYEEVWRSVNKYFSETYPAIEAVRGLRAWSTWPIWPRSLRASSSSGRGG